jgi:hypothetical protein
MMHKSGAVQGGVPSAKVGQQDSSLNTNNRQQVGGMRSGQNRGRPALAEQGGINAVVESILGVGQRQNGNGGGQGRGGRNRAPTNVGQTDKSGNTINQSNRQQAKNRQQSGRNRGRPAMADQGENPEIEGGKRQNVYGGRRNGHGGGRPQQQRRRRPHQKEMMMTINLE